MTINKQKSSQLLEILEIEEDMFIEDIEAGLELNEILGGL